MGSILLAIALVVYNAAANRWPPFHSWAYVPSNVMLAGAVTAVGALAFGMSTAAMGLRWSGAYAGAGLAVALMLPVYAGLGFKGGRTLLRDRRLAGVRGFAAVFMLVVRIPVGTALVEEMVFRGVLLGSLLGGGRAVAVAISSAAFGLWHIVPTWILARENRLSARVVPAGVVLTAIAGAFLAWLRLETGGIAAPVLLHALVNSLAAGAAMIALASGSRGSP